MNIFSDEKVKATAKGSASSDSRGQQQQQELGLTVGQKVWRRIRRQDNAGRGTSADGDLG